MASLSLTDVQAYQDYVELFSGELISQAYYGFPTANAVVGHEGVKGKLTLTELEIGSDIITRSKDTFSPTAGAIKFSPRTLDVVGADMDLKIIPSKWEKSYHAYMRKRGQNNHSFIPFERYIIDKLLSRIKSLQENAIWQGVAAGSPEDTDLLDALFDGYLKIIADEITNTNITPVATGAFTATNAVEKLEDMYQNLGAAYQYMPIACYMSIQNANRAKQDYRERYGKYVTLDHGAFRFDLGDLTFYPLPGLGTSGRVIMTPMDNMHYGMDLESDASVINFEQEDQGMKMFMDFNMGCQIGIIHDDILIVNDQA